MFHINPGELLPDSLKNYLLTVISITHIIH